jgi:hypothetical protein
LAQNPANRTDNLPQTQLEKLDHVFKFCNSNDVVVQAGDFTHQPRSWELTDLLLNYFIDHSWSDKLPQIFSVFGQHDTYMYSTRTRPQTLLGVLNTLGIVRPLTDKPIEFQLRNHKRLYLYGCNYGEIDVPLPEIVDRKSAINVLAIHAPIAPLNETNKHIATINAYNLIRNFPEYDLICCGDIHVKFLIESATTKMFNTGPLLRVERNDYNLKHAPGFFLFDTDNERLQWHEIPHRPAAEIFKATNEALPEVRVDMENRPRPPTTLRPIISILYDLILKNNVNQNVVNALMGVMNDGEQQQFANCFDRPIATGNESSPARTSGKNRPTKSISRKPATTVGRSNVGRCLRPIEPIRK